MKKLLLYGHGGAYNHGAEAILRSSISILRQADCPILYPFPGTGSGVRFG